MKSINTVILGASGYTGAELLRLLQNHPAFKIVALTGDSQAGKPIEAVYPHLPWPQPARACETHRSRFQQRATRFLLPAPRHHAGDYCWPAQTYPHRRSLGGFPPARCERPT